MRTNSSRSVFIGAAIAAAVFAGPIFAGSPIHRMPAYYGRTFPTYEIRIVRVPSGRPLTVQVIDKDSGRLVTNADVTMRHRRWLGVKAVPQFQYLQLALRPDGRGDYVCSNGPLPAGDKIVLRAHVPGDPTSTWLTVD